MLLLILGIGLLLVGLVCVGVGLLLVSGKILKNPIVTAILGFFAGRATK